MKVKETRRKTSKPTRATAETALGKNKSQITKAKRATQQGAAAKSATGEAASGKVSSSMAKAKALNKPVPQAQWDMPAGFRTDGQIATLKEVVDTKVTTLSLSEVTPQQRADLVVKRIEKQPDFKVAMVGAGIVDKDRAIAEVKTQSSVGKALIEIEQRVLNNLIERGSKGSSSQTS